MTHTQKKAPLRSFFAKMTLQWRLKALTTLLVTVACIFMYFFISHSAVSGMDDLHDYVIHIDQNDSSPITFQVDPSMLFPQINDQLAQTKQLSANAAHELRTPLAVMQTNLEVFSKKKEPSVSEYQTLFSTILEQTNRLSHLASILLDMTGMQRVKRSDTISLAALADEVLCDLAPIADQKQIKLSQSETDCIVTGSYLLLYRAVFNLVENAIKYNHHDGSVHINIKDENGFALISIKDTGIGIAPENQEKIFTPFFCVDKSRSRTMGGAGLGLALVAEIAQLHNGTVYVSESDSEGSTIILKLPL